MFASPPFSFLSYFLVFLSLYSSVIALHAFLIRHAPLPGPPVSTYFSHSILLSDNIFSVIRFILFPCFPPCYSPLLTLRTFSIHLPLPGPHIALCTCVCFSHLFSLPFLHLFIFVYSSFTCIKPRPLLLDMPSPSLLFSPSANLFFPSLPSSFSSSLSLVHMLPTPRLSCQFLHRRRGWECMEEGKGKRRREGAGKGKGRREGTRQGHSTGN